MGRWRRGRSLGKFGGDDTGLEEFGVKLTQPLGILGRAGWLCLHNPRVTRGRVGLGDGLKDGKPPFPWKGLYHQADLGWNGSGQGFRRVG